MIKKQRARLVAAVTVIALGVPVGVGITALAVSEARAQGDIAAGKAKAAAVCASCHGADGKGLTAEWPNLAGQVDAYTQTQLKMFKSGERKNAIMAGTAAALSDQDIANLGAYYASLPAIAGAVSKDDAKAAEKGAKLFRGGDQATSIPACMSCHGPAGLGLKPNFPRLAGQQAQYIEKQLIDYKSGARANDIMAPIAFKLSAQQIRELSLFVSGLN